MFVHVRCNSGINITAPIYSIEFGHTATHDAICLLLELQPEEWELFRALNIVNETVEVTEEG
jgi:hypothetical protein